MEEKTSQLPIKLNGFEYYTFRDYVGVVLRRKWLIITAAMSLALLTAVVAYFWPNTYRASTVILVEPRKVSEGMVMSTVSTDVSDRMASLREQILSETKLAQVIDELGLYKDLKKKESPQQIIETMQKAIQVEVIASTMTERGFGAFRVSYENPDAATAAKVTNRLASLFIEENIRSREQQVLGTVDFIDKEVQDAKKDLQDKEDALQRVRLQNIGVLPESEASHVQALASLQLDLRGELDAIERISQQKVYLQSVMSQSKPVVDLDKARGGGDLAGLESELAAKQSELDQLQARYGPKFPDVIKKTNEVNALQAEIDKRSKEGKPTTASIPKVGRNPVIESQLQAYADEEQRRQAHIAELKQQIAFHEGKLEKIPIVQQQITAVSRDYDSAQDHYRKLLDRKFSADMSSDLETRQKGERFVILDPAQAPDSPATPNRPLLDAAGLVAGVLVGAFLAFLVEFVDGSIKTTRQASDEMGTTILAEIPGIATKAERRRSLVFTIAAASCNLFLFFAYAAVVVLSR